MNATNNLLPGHLMRREMAEATGVFSDAATADHRTALLETGFALRRSVYTVARGSSDAAANVLSYELMREAGVPVTSLPPSVFSLGNGVDLGQSGVLVISQSGASDDLVRSAEGARSNGAVVAAITNKEKSRVSDAANVVLPIGAGPELAVPATKSVVGSIAAGMALISGMVPGYQRRCAASAEIVGGLAGIEHPDNDALVLALQRAQHVYVIGRDAGLGAAQEVALKFKECCALHAEAYSSSEVLHGPLQLVTRPLMILMMDTEDPKTQPSLDIAEQRFRQAGCDLWRVRPSDVGATGLTPAAAAAVLINLMYPVILSAALALGFDPDHPDTLAKETLTL